MLTVVIVVDEAKFKVEKEREKLACSVSFM
jgi:hypothetical protein